MDASTNGRAHHALLDHTGEIELSVFAPSFAELLAEAGRALAELQAGALRGAEGEAVPVEAAGRDREALLVEWLNALVFLSETQKRVFTEFAFRELSDRALSADVRGFFPDQIHAAVKAATYHRVRVAPRDGGLEARVVLDV